MRWILALMVAFASLDAAAATATLEIASGERRLTYTQTQLLARPDVRTLSITDSVYGQRYTTFKAIPIANLFKGLAAPDLSMVRCNGTDGFSAILDKTRLFDTNPKASQAYLAIEDPRQPWPPLADQSDSAGPFYLVWTNAQSSAIGPEEWPYKIASLEILPDPRREFPKAYPVSDAPAAVQRGFQSFRKNCFACHKINGDGAGTIGPDLNLPMNPTDYLNSQVLVRLIRNPASVRAWPGMAMRGFSAESLPDQELADLIAYLQYMSKTRAGP